MPRPSPEAPWSDRASCAETQASLARLDGRIALGLGLGEFEHGLIDRSLQLSHELMFVNDVAAIDHYLPQHAGNRCRELDLEARLQKAVKAPNLSRRTSQSCRQKAPARVAGPMFQSSATVAHSY